MNECTHNEMVERDDPDHAWQCANCGYVYTNTPQRKGFDEVPNGD